MIKLIVGLGNPGKQYEFTRHNIPWIVFDYFLEENWNKKFRGEIQVKKHNQSQFYFLKPHTFMNLSGESVIQAMNFYKITLAEILIIHDELDLPFGTIAFKSGGGLAGHNGLKSIAQHCGGPEFKRLRLGIGRPVHGDVSNYVLSPYSNDEQNFLEDYVKLGAEAIDEVMKSGFEKASNKYSKKTIMEINK